MHMDPSLRGLVQKSGFAVGSADSTNGQASSGASRGPRVFANIVCNAS